MSAIKTKPKPSSLHPPPSTISSTHSPLRTFAFWPCLLFAAALYATVALASPLLTYITLRQQHDELQLRLVALEDQVSHAEKVIDALQHDPAFAKAQARADFHAASPNEQRIPVGGTLALAAPAASPQIAITPPDLPWYTPLIRLVADHRQLGNILLAVAAGLVIYAFAWLQDGRESRIEDRR